MNILKNPASAMYATQLTFRSQTIVINQKTNAIPNATLNTNPTRFARQAQIKNGVAKKNAASPKLNGGKATALNIIDKTTTTHGNR